MSEAAATAKDAAYRVLARTTRPVSFDELIGQGAMVRTLTNAFEAGRLAHAFVLTGVRGVGKTTTARIIARALNCVGPDGKGGPTIQPCGVCEFCRAISEDRLVDVVEIDAASHTGVDNIREVIDAVRYRPVAARYKVYIIDEVHMLSKPAFNALLKTLEEPPDHVKFILATTEIRKVPVTVLSRCQRFDLRRVDVDTLSAHFAKVAEREKVALDSAAIRLIAHAADGSVRDGMSLLDQAIAVGAGAGGAITELQVRAMLGLADRARSFDIIERVMAGDPAGAVHALSEDYANGADPIQLLQDLLDVVHWVTRLKVSPSAGADPMVAELDRVRGAELAGKLSMAELTRAWQMLLKGLREAQTAPSPLQAAEMILIRLAYLTDLPPPAEAVKMLGEQKGGGTAPPAAPPAPRPARAPVSSAAGTAAVARSEPAPAVAPRSAPQASLASFADVVALCEAKGERVLRSELVRGVALVSFQPGHISIRLEEGTPRDLPNRLSRFLQQATGTRWMVSPVTEGGGPTLGAQMDAAADAKRTEIRNHPLVRSILDTFPGAELEQVKQLGGAQPPAAAHGPTSSGGEPPPASEDDYGSYEPESDPDSDPDL
jgi:DNA polymerase-3 subunit gamma/tau